MGAVKSLFINCVAIGFLCVSGFADASPNNTHKKETKNIQLSYDVYAGGIHALDAELSIAYSPKEYNIYLTAGTQGFLKKVANWSGAYKSDGKQNNDSVYPVHHTAASTWKKKTETKTFTYDGKGSFISYKVSEAGQDTTPQDLDKTLSKDTTDLLSSTFHLMSRLPDTKKCDGNDLIFDGDRNFRLKFENTKTEMLKKTDYNIYAGESILCEVEVKPESGKWRKKPRGWLSIQEQGRNKGALPTVWFGKVAGPDGIYAPIKIRVKTDYGTLFMHLTAIKTQ